MFNSTTCTAAPTMQRLESRNDANMASQPAASADSLLAAIGWGQVAQPPQAAWLALSAAAQSRPQLFRAAGVWRAILAWLRTSEDPDSPSRVSSFAPAACCVLQAAFQNAKDWPLDFVRMYVEDSLGPRAWVENRSECKLFVSNIQTCWKPGLATQSKPCAPSASPSVRSIPSSAASWSSTPSLQPVPLCTQMPNLSLPAGRATEEDSSTDSGEEEVLEEAVIEPASSSSAAKQAEASLPAVYPRYSSTAAQAHDIILSALRNRMQIAVAQNQSLWQVVISLTEFASLSACRLLAAQHIQKWLETPAQSKHARGLLIALAKHADPAVAEDEQLVHSLLRLHVPAQQTTLYIECMAMIGQKGRPFLRQIILSRLEESEGDKLLAQILQHMTAASEPKRPGKMAFWTPFTIAREMAHCMRQQLRDKPSGRLLKNFMGCIRSLTLDVVNVAELTQELLVLSPKTLRKLKNTELSAYIKAIADLIPDLLIFRASACQEATRAFLEQQARQQKKDGMSQDDASHQKQYANWQFRLLAIRDIADIHAAAASYALNVAVEVLPELPAAPLPTPTAAGKGKKAIASLPADALSLFRSMLLLEYQVQDKTDRSPEAFAVRYVGVKDGMCRKLSMLPPLKSGTPSGITGRATVLSLIEDLVRRAATLITKREQDPMVARADWLDLAHVELQFQDTAVIHDLFSLARYEPAVEAWARQGVAPEKVPQLAEVTLFWRVALLLLLIASSCSSMGSWLWSHCPTLRCLMQMVVCDQFHFPPPGTVAQLRRPLISSDTDMEVCGNNAKETNPDELQILALDAELREQEEDWVNTLRGHRAGKKRKREAEQSLNGASPSTVKMQKDKEKGLSSLAATLSVESPDAEAKPPKRPQSGRLGAASNRLTSPKKDKLTVPIPDLIYLDLYMPPRKPPPGMLQQLRSLNNEYCIGARLRRSTKPDFVAAAIAAEGSSHVSREVLDSTLEWLAPAVAAEPEVTMKRLPINCVCHMYAIALSIQKTLPASFTSSKAGTDVSRDEHCRLQTRATVPKSSKGDRQAAVSDALHRLKEPLQHVIISYLHSDQMLTPAEQAKRAVQILSVLMAELKEPEISRRVAGRWALQELLPGSPTGGTDHAVSDSKDAQLHRLIFEQKDLQSQLEEDCCLWLFTLHRLQCFDLLWPAVFEGLREALMVESSHVVMGHYLLALLYHCHVVETDDNQESCVEKFRSRSCAVAVACVALTRRKMIAKAALQHNQLLQDSLMDNMCTQLLQPHIRQSQMKEVDRLWHSEYLVRLLLRQQEVQVPSTLLSACLVLLSGHSASELPPALLAIMQNLFTASPGADFGAHGARMLGDAEQAALNADDWIQLAKSACPTVSDAAARCMPGLFLPRLLLCSGLSPGCFTATLNRLDELGQNDPSGEVFRDLLSPASTASWGMARATESRKILTRKLARRVIGYQNLFGTLKGKVPQKGSLLAWLSAEIQAKPSQRAQEHQRPSMAASGEIFSIKVITDLAPSEQEGEGCARQHQKKLQPVDVDVDVMDTQPPAVLVEQEALLSSIQAGNMDRLRHSLDEGLRTGNVELTRMVLDAAAPEIKHVLAEHTPIGAQDTEQSVAILQLLSQGSLVMQSQPVSDGPLALLAQALARLCGVHWSSTDPNLRQQSQDLLWMLSFQGGTGQELFWAPCFKWTLLAAVVQTYSLSQVEQIANRLLNLAGEGQEDDGFDEEAGKMDVMSALGLLSRWFRASGRSPLASEQGLVTGSHLALTACAEGVDLRATQAHPARQWYKEDSWLPCIVIMSQVEVEAIMRIVIHALQSSQKSGQWELASILCLRLSSRNSFFRGVMIKRLVDRAGTVAAQAMAENNHCANGEAYMLFRVYVLFADAVTSTLSATQTSEPDFVRCLSLGQTSTSQGFTCTAVSEELVEAFLEVQRQLYAGRQGSAIEPDVRRLYELTRRQPFVFLSNLPYFGNLLYADASPTSAQRRFGAPLSPSDVHAASEYDRNGQSLAALRLSDAGSKLKVTCWGICYTPVLWDTALDLLMGMNPATIAAYEAPRQIHSTDCTSSVVRFLAMYVHLLAVQIAFRSHKSQGVKDVANASFTNETSSTSQQQAAHGCLSHLQRLAERISALVQLLDKELSLESFLHEPIWQTSASPIDILKQVVDSSQL